MSDTPKDLNRRIEELERWKREAALVLDEWETVWLAAGSPGKLGQSKPYGMLKFIQEAKYGDKLNP